MNITHNEICYCQNYANKSEIIITFTLTTLLLPAAWTDMYRIFYKYSSDTIITIMRSDYNSSTQTYGEYYSYLDTTIEGTKMFYASDWISIHLPGKLKFLITIKTATSGNNLSVLPTIVVPEVDKIFQENAGGSDKRPILSEYAIGK